MRWSWLLIPVFLLAAGCGLFSERLVQLNPADPVLIALRADLDAGAIDQAQFEKRVSEALGATVRDVQPDWTATAASVADDVKKAVVAEIKANPPPKSGGVPDLVLWALGILGVGGAAAWTNLSLGTKKVESKISSTVATPGPRPVAAGGGE